MGAVKGTGNRTTEMRLRYALVRSGISGWVLHTRDIEGRPDFYFPAAGLAVFVDGCFWHGCPRCGHVPKKNSAFWRMKIARNRARDKRTSSRLRRHGIRVLRIWEHRLNRDVYACLATIQRQLQATAR